MVRLLVIIFFFVLSGLAIFRAPTNALWYAAILVGEFPHLFLFIELLLFLWGYREQRFVGLGNLLIVLSVLLYLSPVVRAWAIGGKLDAEMSASFPLAAGENKAPFHPWRMFSGWLAAEVPYRSLPYTTHGATPLHLDFYKAEGSGKRPCVVVVHGGSWAGGDSRQLPQLNSYLARKGYHVASINYRFAPVNRSPAQLNDLFSALDYLRRNGEKLAVDTSNIVLLGRSAGGQLVLAAAYSKEVPAVKGVIAFYGPADMVWGAQNPADPWVFNSGKVLEDYIGGDYASSAAAYEASSPINFVSPAAPPTLLLHGKNDVLVAYEHSVRLVRKLKQQGVPHFLLTLPWATHGFDYHLYGPGGQLSTYCIERFLKNVTAAPPR